LVSKITETCIALDAGGRLVVWYNCRGGRFALRSVVEEYFKVQGGAIAMAEIREPGNLLRRYLAGESEAVWAEMTALGPSVREAPHFDDAWAVARETMRRARHNVELIIGRLDRVGYQFWNGKQGLSGPQPIRMMLGGQLIEYPSTEAMVEHALKRDLSRIPEGIRRHVDRVRDRLATLGGLAQGLQQRQVADLKKKAAITDHLKDEAVFSPPAEEEIATLRELETKGMVLPLSLRAWAEEVGDVNLAGAHPALCFWQDENFPGVHADPLMVFLDDFMFEAEGWVEARDAGEDPGTIDPIFGWDAEAKARLAIEDEQLDYGYSIELPNAGADAALDGEPHKTTFVNYLRIAFRWGGFPGWERHENRPERELAILTEGLLPI
jgi:hypothetical protein